MRIAGCSSLDNCCMERNTRSEHVKNLTQPFGWNLLIGHCPIVLILTCDDIFDDGDVVFGMDI
ncbi:MAG: hypothetical protein RLY46_471 [Bacteroidota bacterium]|jgi:hypothetical protein